MTRLLRGLAVASAVALTGATAFADQPGVMKVTDDAGLFSAEGVARAAEQFDGTRFKSATHYGIGTISTVPAGKQADLAAAKTDADRGRVFGAVARDTAFKNDRRGDVFTLVYKDEKGRFYAVTVSDKQSDVHRSFGDKKAQTVNDEFTKSLKRVKEKNLTGDAAKREMDEALLAATKHVIDDLQHTAAPETHAAAGHTNAAAPKAAGSGIMSYVCIGLVAFAGIWLVIGLVRSLFGGGGGYGGGGMGGGYGGGGGGFMSSLMGGMFGAAAGMYLYDNFMGGHSSSAMAGDNYGGDTGGVDNADGNWDDGGQAGGGDGWDNTGDAGGGDVGGGGGGWDDGGGGGGDFGGGGDW